MVEGTRKSKVNKGRLAFAIIVLVLAIFVAVVVKNIIALHVEKSKLQRQETELKSKKEELTAELQNADDLEYIEEQARKLLKMIKPGEVLYILNGDNPNPQTHSESADHVPDLEAKEETPAEVPAETTVETVPEETYYQEEEVYQEEYAEEETYEESEAVDTESSYSEEGEGYYEETSEEETYQEETYSEEGGESYDEG